MLPTRRDERRVRCAHTVSLGQAPPAAQHVVLKQLVEANPAGGAAAPAIEAARAPVREARLRGLDHPHGDVRVPARPEDLLNLVYDRIVAPGLAQSIELRIPRNDNGSHAVKMHQMLVEEVGIPVLKQHIGILLLLMDRQTTWNGFMTAVDLTLPKVRQLPPRPRRSPPGQGSFDF